MPARSPRLRALGVAIREIRRAAGLTQEKLGERSGLDKSYISGLERGQRNPTLKVLLKLKAGLDISLADLFEVVERVEKKPEAETRRRRRPPTA